MTPTCCWRTFSPISRVRPRCPRPMANPSAGRACRSCIPRAAENSPRTAPFANTARTFGRSRRYRFSSSHMRKQESHSPAQRLRGAPQQLIADGKRREIFPSHRKFTQAANGYVQTSADRGRREVADRGLAIIRPHAHPGVGAGEQLFDLGAREIPLELDRQSLRVAAHRAHPHADAFHRHGVRLRSEYLVRFGARLPFLAALAGAQILVDPRNQARRERHAELRPGKLGARECTAYGAIDIENAGSGVAPE